MRMYRLFALMLVGTIEVSHVSGCGKAKTFAPANLLNSQCVLGVANSVGVGSLCSALSAQCINTQAPVCTAELSVAPVAVCTRPCTNNVDCGAGAACAHDSESGLSLCLPSACVQTNAAIATGTGSAGCPPGAANEVGVGAACSKGGNQCAASLSPFCTVDYANVPAAFCTRPCTSNADCGTNATCAGQGASAQVCIPNACLSTASTLPTSVTSAPPTSIVASPNCPPPAANDAGVGAACTKGGKQCASTAAPYCTVDYIDTTAAFCTKTCSSDADCGTDAVCQADPNNASLTACIPKACMTTISTGKPISAPQCGGNSKGVGKTCTPGGGQCNNVTASLCTGDVDPLLPNPVCTMVCTSSHACGELANCVSAAGFTGLAVCVANQCINPQQ